MPVLKAGRVVAFGSATLVAAMLLTSCSPAEDGAPRGGGTPSARSSPADSPSNTSAALAAPAKSYVDAVNAADVDALVGAFSSDGRVIDVDRSVDGRSAIRAWAEDEVIGGRLEVLSVSEMEGGQDVLVHWAPAGSNGWRAHYRFTMTDTEITLADLQYA